MKEDNDIFKKFRDSFSKIDGHFHILEQRVPVERQMEYFKYSEKIRISRISRKWIFRFSRIVWMIPNRLWNIRSMYCLCSRPHDR